MSGLERFVQAQDEGGAFDGALAELRAGRKHGHWIWFVFPQLRGLGLSRMSQMYAIRDAHEAADYLRHPVLFRRLQAVTAAVAGHAARGVRLDQLMGSAVDAQKLVSSLTLFGRVARGLRPEAPEGSYETFSAQAESILGAASSQGFARCRHTLSQLEPSG